MKVRMKVRTKVQMKVQMKVRMKIQMILQTNMTVVIDEFPAVSLHSVWSHQ